MTVSFCRQKILDEFEEVCAESDKVKQDSLDCEPIPTSGARADLSVSPGGHRAQHWTDSNWQVSKK